MLLNVPWTHLKCPPSIRSRSVWGSSPPAAKCQTFGKVFAPPCATRCWWVDRAERSARAHFLISPPPPPLHPSSPGHHDETAGPLCFPFTHQDWSNVLFTTETSATYPLDMAPGLRSGRTGHPKVVGAGGADPGGRSPPRRTDAGGEEGRRCLRTRWRAGAAGMLANCLLSVGTLLLLVRCALAAEGKHTTEIIPPITHRLMCCIHLCHIYMHIVKSWNIFGAKWVFCCTQAAFCNPHI